ncbi:DedA family protein [Candidatus Poribacteria bacterium]|mgnify:CR=1 FL=1|jgi:membrane protein YqaA with SNARE-associated domain|nr:DedA family protein [Candidatus Poribacteria bacterium]MBT5536462.1 DedA family protein [Candidatus Poribacteria bacterium]MBT5709626.1 DedA family protein [Candidatus Poribacteria bacterium]MBT7097322.1 DedA family protein [Candidatus Poribacteria bacterium]MBT7807654.1 DedA family protein [Candidatus Poribacteria bacterium]
MEDETPNDAAPEPAVHVEGWGVFRHVRRVKAWVEARAESRHASAWLFLIAAMESSFFPIPPDVLLLPLGASAPKRALRFAFICTLGSVIGGVGGWAIGYFLYGTVGRAIFEFYGITHEVEEVLARYGENGFAAIVVAGFTPIPYKVFTILAGWNGTVALPVLIGASCVGRGARFFLEGGLLRVAGPAIMPWVDRYFDMLVVVFTVLLIGGFVVVKMVL